MLREPPTLNEDVHASWALGGDVCMFATTTRCRYLAVQANELLLSNPGCWMILNVGSQHLNLQASSCTQLLGVNGARRANDVAKYLQMFAVFCRHNQSTCAAHRS